MEGPFNDGVLSHLNDVIKQRRGAADGHVGGTHVGNSVDSLRSLRRQCSKQMDEARAGAAKPEDNEEVIRSVSGLILQAC